MIRSCICVSVCVSVLKLLLDCSTDSLHFWRKMVLLRSLSPAHTQKKINFRLHARVIAQIEGLTELNNHYIRTYGLK